MLYPLDPALEIAGRLNRETVGFRLDTQRFLVHRLSTEQTDRLERVWSHTDGAELAPDDEI